MRVNSETGAFCCMAGCGARGGDILAYQMAMHGIDFVAAAKALGAWVEDKDARTPRRRPLPFPARDALEILAEEANIVALAGANLARGVPITEDDKSRILTASRRITSISEAVL